MKKYLITLSLLFIMCIIVLPHDLWLEKENNIFKLLYGHKHSSHSGDMYMEYNPHYVKEIKCIVNNKIKDINFEKKHPILINEQCDIVFVVYSSGFWTKTAYGTKNVSKEQEKNVIKSWYSEENVKYIDKWNDNYQKPVTEHLEIVPLVDLNKLKKGDKIRLQIYYKGKPANNVIVAYGDEPKGSTDEEGKINIKVKNTGFQIITASLTQPSDGIKTDEIIYTTNLNFNVEK